MRDWKNVVVEMGPHDNTKLGPQFTGGSNSIRMYWRVLRNAGASARQMLIEAAAKTWNVPANEINTKAGVLSHPSGKTAKYGDMSVKASALAIPKDLKLKEPKDFSIVKIQRKMSKAKNSDRSILV